MSVGLGRTAGIFMALLWLGTGQALGADWPQYQHDEERSGVAAEALPPPLHRRWSYQSRHAPAPAWPDPFPKEFHKLDFDRAHQLVVGQGKVFFGSSANHKVYALDAESGQELWSFFTGGPVRFAPAFWKSPAGNPAEDRVFVVSDDGRLYCLSATDGKLVWKRRPGPRNDCLLGNGQMISRWPARGGVMVKNDIVYFSAGMWPADGGIFIQACAAVDGRQVWLNDTCGSIKLGYGVGGVAPQGYMAAHGDLLFVDAGRAKAFTFDLQDGRLIRGQDWNDYRNRRGPSKKVYFDKTAHGEGLIYTFENSYSQADASKTSRVVALDPAIDPRRDRAGRRFKWRQAFARHSHSVVRAGNVIYAGQSNMISALDSASGKLLWQTETKGGVHGLAVAEGRLFASLDTGEITCYSTESASPVRQIRAREAAQPLPTGQSASDKVRRLLEESGQRAGYCLYFGETDGSLPSELARQSRLIVFLLETSAPAAAALRQKLDQAGLYGVRVTVLAAGLDDLPRYFADLIVVAEDTPIAPALGRQLYRLLRPCGGVALLGTVPTAGLRAVGIPEAEISEQGGRIKLIRGQLPDARDWNRPGLDGRVKAPLEMLWFGVRDETLPPPLSNTIPVVSAGRYFVPRFDHLVAVNAYNGREMWARDLASAWKLYNCLSADAETVYIGIGDINLALDAATGREKKVYGLAPSAARFPLTPSHNFDLEVDEKHSGEVTLTADEEGLSLKLVTVDPKIFTMVSEANPRTAHWSSWARWDSWELFFDFRATGQRAGLYSPGCFHLVVVPARDADGEAFCLPGAGPIHPRVDVSGQTVSAGTETQLRMDWTELEKIIGFKPLEFGFALTLNSTDAERDPLKRTHVFGSAQVKVDRKQSIEVAHCLNNGWATFVIGPDEGSAKTTTRFTELAGSPEEWKELQDARRKRRQEWVAPLAMRANHAQSRLHPLTGETVPLLWSRGKGCGGIGPSSATMFVGRSSDLAYFDYADDSGLRNYPGVRPECRGGHASGLGLLLFSWGLHCTCSYPMETSFALVNSDRPRHEDWAFFYDRPAEGLVRRLALNFGAPGDRRDQGRVLWTAFPKPRHIGDYALGPQYDIPWGMPLPVAMATAEHGGSYRRNAALVTIAGAKRPWIYASGQAGIRSLKLRLNQFPALVSQPTPLPPKIDGELSEPCWDGKSPVPLSEWSEGSTWAQGNKSGPYNPALQKPKHIAVFIRHDSEKLYVACSRQAIRDRKGEARLWAAKSVEHDAKVWEDDSIELFFSDGDLHSSVHLGLSASGTRFDGRTVFAKDQEGDAAWNGEWSGKVLRDEGSLSFEIAIPWRTMIEAGLKRESLALNLKINPPRAGWLTRLMYPGYGVSKPFRLGRKGLRGVQWLRCKRFAPLGFGRPHVLPARPYAVNLHFAELEDVPPGQRVFDLKLQGQTVLEGFDIVREAGGANRALIKSFQGIRASDEMTLEFISRPGPMTEETLPILSGLEMQAEFPLTQIAQAPGYECRRMTAKVDGDLKEWFWRGGMRGGIECRQPGEIGIHPDHWSGPNDSSFRFSTYHDDKYVYFAVEVTDDRAVNDPTREPWVQDALELRLDARPEPARSAGRGQGELDSFLLIALIPGETAAESILHRREKLPPGLEAFCVKTDQGFNAEIAVPTAYLDAKQGGPWQAFRLNVAVEDFDGEVGDMNQASFISWKPDWRRDRNVPGSGTFVKK